MKVDQTKPKRHPAKYSDAFLPLFATLLQGYGRILDPLAGTCKIGRIREYGWQGEIHCNELEWEWARQAPDGVIVRVGDAASLPYTDGWFDAIAVSPVYGNRCSDHHDAKDASRRNTYTHALQRPLTPGNTGVMQWGEDYRLAHQRIWAECRRVLRVDGRFVLNISDHIRAGKVVPVTQWHIDTLTAMGFEVEDHHRIPTPRLRHGANAGVRVEHESVVVLRRVC